MALNKTNKKLSWVHEHKVRASGYYQELPSTYYENTKLAIFLKFYFQNSLSLVRRAFVSSDQQPRILADKMLLCYLFYYKNLLCFLYFSKTLLESRQSFQRMIKKVTELRQKRKAKCYHRQQDFRITQGLSSNSNFTQVLWPWASYSINLQVLYFGVAQWQHTWHVKSLEFHPQHRKREKTKQKTKKELSKWRYWPPSLIPNLTDRAHVERESTP